MGCYPVAEGTICMVGGSKPLGAACNGTIECAPGSVCGSTDIHPEIICRKLCDASATQCMPTEGCYLNAMLGYGVCVPP